MTESKASILLVDDDRDILKLVSLRLTAAGYSVLTAESGAQALAQLAVARPRLVITDLRMEGMDGMGLFEAIRRSDATLPVIILTAHGTIPEAVEATKRGVLGYLTKPFDPQTLLQEVEKALHHGGPSAAGESGVSDEWRREFNTRSPAMEAVLERVAGR